MCGGRGGGGGGGGQAGPLVFRCISGSHAARLNIPTTSTALLHIVVLPPGINTEEETSDRW